MTVGHFHVQVLLTVHPGVYINIHLMSDVVTSG